MTIRAAAKNEADVLSAIAIESKAYWGYSEEFLRACEDELRVSPEDIESTDLTVCLHEEGDEIAGFYVTREISSSRAELEALFVRPAYIGKGFGRSLLQHAVSDLQRRGFATLCIQGDPHATRFYLAAGAIHTGERPSESIPGRNLPIFEIDLL